MKILINDHPVASPCYGVGESFNLDIVADDTTGAAEVYTWVRETSAPGTPGPGVDPLDWLYADVELQTGATSLYNHTVVEADYGNKIRCIVSGRRSHAVELLPLEPMNKTSISRHAVPYAYEAGAVATLAFIPAGVNMSYEVFDPDGALLAGPIACVNGETYVYTTVSGDPAEGFYKIVVTGDGGDAITGGEIRAFATDQELLLWSRKKYIGSTGIYQAGYNDVGFEVQFGQIERNTWLIQQFTADLDDLIVLRMDGNNNNITGAPATLEVSVDGLFHTTLTWVGIAGDDGRYEAVDQSFARHVRGAPEFSFTSRESMVLDFRTKPDYEITVSDVALGVDHSTHVYGYNTVFGTGSGTVGSSGALEALFVDDPDGNTTTGIVAKFADASNVFSQFSMEITLQETGDSCYLWMDPATNEAGTGTDTNYYKGISDTNTPLMDNIGAALKTIAEDVSGPILVTATGDVTPIVITDANEADTVAMTENGTAYVGTPVVTFSTGTGGTATGTATMAAGSITGIAVDTVGSYLDSELPITVTVEAPKGDGTSPADATADVTAKLATDANTAKSVEMTNQGAKYFTTPAVTFAVGTGSTATGTAVMYNGFITSISVDTPGSYLDSELPITVTVDASAGIPTSATFDVRIFN
jgi:hypothetical protein